jgi:hypothetical protein
MDIHVHIHNDEVKEGKKPRGKASSKPAPSTRRKGGGKPMTRKTQLAINRGRRAKGLKPIKWKKKGR